MVIRDRCPNFPFVLLLLENSQKARSMKIVLQRVSQASVEVEGKVVGEIETGIMALCGFGKEDDSSCLAPLASKLANLRIFPDEKGRFHYSLLDTEGGLLCVPQFTLYADTSKGRRPEFFSAKDPGEAIKLFDAFVLGCKNQGLKKVESGVFGAEMKVSLVNEGPVTITLEN